MRAFLLVFLGGGIGAALRHGVNLVVWWLFGTPMAATILENISGSFVMGLLIGLFAFKLNAPPWLQLFLTTGILGGYTTFSTFSLDVASLWERNLFVRAGAYVALSVIGALGGIALGLFVARRL
jgi:CrcB protein